MKTFSEFLQGSLNEEITGKEVLDKAVKVGDEVHVFFDASNGVQYMFIVKNGKITAAERQEDNKPSVPLKADIVSKLERRVIRASRYSVS